MKKITLILITLLCSQHAFSQFVISGNVRDKQTHQPLHKVTIVMDKTVQASTTDDNGNYELTQVTAGSHTIEIRHVGYATVHLTLDVTGNMIQPVEMASEVIYREPVEITATRANEKSGMAFSEVDKATLEKNNSGRDIPYLLESVPSLVPTSDAGTGIGYTALRIRGTDATRVNVTVDGIPMNDSESQILYWVDMPDMASSVDNIQVQRGVGTSVNGASAFGGSVNIQTNKPTDKPYLTTSGTYGSFNTLKTTATIGTGLLDNKWSFDGRLSKITSDGYIDRATSDLKSFYVAGGYYGKNDIVKLKVFSGKEITYQSWYGVPEPSLDTNRTWNAYTYENQVDNYQQDHYQLFYTHIFSDKLSFNTALHYTYGNGYYEEYETDQSFYEYGLEPVILGSDTLYNTDLVRRKWLKNDFYGVVFSAIYDPSKRINIIVGGAWNQYDGDHYGEVIWVRYASNGEINHLYYDENGFKTDFNAYAKTTVNVFSKLDVFADVQVRNVDYEFMGLNDSGETFPQHDNLTFFNPKAGITYTLNPGNYGYLSFGIGNKEPSRDDYVESTSRSRPRPEKLYDFELGYQLKKKKYTLGINYYYMLYDDQLVLTGAINDVGNYTRTNIEDSFREGIELEGQWNGVENFSVSGNITFNRTEIDEFREYTYDYDTDGHILQVYHNTDIAFSPHMTGYLALGYKIISPLEVQLVNRYVGEQYLDNTSKSSSVIDPYFVSDLRINYILQPKFMKSVDFSLMVNNIFNVKYESNGYAYSYYYGGEKITENYYYPQAGRNFMGMVTLKF